MESRHYIKSFIKKREWPTLTKGFLFFLCIVVSLFITLSIADHSYDDSMRNTLFVAVFAVSLWLTEAIPPFVVGILIIILLVWLLGYPAFNANPLDVTVFTNTWSSPVIFLMLGGFFIATGMKETKLDQWIFQFSYNLFGGKPSNLLFGLMLTTAFLSMIMSNTATAAMMIGAITPFANSREEGDKLSKTLLLGIPLAASIGGMGTIIGSPPNAIAVGILESNGIQVDFVKWMFYGFPLAIGLIVLFWYIFKSSLDKDQDVIQLTLNEVKLTPEEQKRRRIVVLTLLVTVGLWLTSPLHGISATAVSSIPLLMLTVSGIIKGEEFRSLPWDTLALVAGGLSLGVALEKSGLATHLLSKVSLDPSNLIIALLILSLLTIILSNVMSNTASASILIPVAVMLLPGNELIACLTVGLSSSCALFLPVSTPPNAIAFATGKLEQKDFRKGGLLAGVIAPAFIVIWLMLVV